MIHKVGQINRKSWDRRRKRRNSDRFGSDRFIPVDLSIVCFVFSSSSCCVVANFTSASFSTKRRNFVISKWVLRRCEMSNSIFQRWRGYWCRSRKDAWSPARWWISLFSIQNCFFLSFSKSFLKSDPPHFLSERNHIPLSVRLHIHTHMFWIANERNRIFSTTNSFYYWLL